MGVLFQLVVRDKLPYMTIPVQSIMLYQQSSMIFINAHLKMIFSLSQMQRFLLSFFILLFVSFCRSSFLKADDLKVWKVPAGYSVKIDSSNWKVPVAIQFTPQPQGDPKSPLYYVAERQGVIKVVTRDRSVFVYADLRARLQKIVNLCVDDQAQRLYVTGIEQQGDRFFNHLISYRRASEDWGLQGQKSWEMAEWFQKEPTSSSKISSCFVGSDQALYLGMDDGGNPEKTQSKKFLNGKILRMDLEGKARMDNPFYDPENPNSVASYIYAYGFRNPRVLTQGPKEDLYTIDHSPKADRLLKVMPGKNGLWSGEESAMLMNSIATWMPPSKPETVIFLKRHEVFAQWSQRLLIPSTARTRLEALWLDPQLGAKAPPEPLLEYIDNQNTEKPLLGPIALGPDGIYFSKHLPKQQGKVAILKIVPDASGQASQIPPALNGEEWFRQLECFSCHRISGRGGLEGPALDNLIPRLETRLASKQYKHQLEQMDQLTEKLYVQYKIARLTLRNLSGKEQVEFWIRHRLKEPRFDSINSQMPNLQLTEEQIEALTQYLMTLSTEVAVSQKNQWSQWADDVKFYLTTHLWVWLGLMLFIGGMLGIGIQTLIRFLWHRLFRRT